jgi:voltage-gated potassium channel
MLFHQVGEGLLLVILTLWLQSVGMGALVKWTRHAAQRDLHALTVFRSAGLVVQLTTAVIALHGLEISLWASFYRWVCFPSWDLAFYFSASSYSTLGCGDVTLPSTWRTFGPVESLVGVLMCGVSVSLLFAIVTRLISRETRLSRK